MKLHIPCLLLFVLITGCSIQNKWTPNDWKTIEPSISAATEFAARTAFQNDKIKPIVPKLCESMPAVIVVLENFEDPDATLEGIKRAALKAIMDTLPPGNVRNTASLVVDQILSITFLYAKDKYTNLIEKDEAQVAIIIARGASKGMNNACKTNISSFNFQIASGSN